MAISNERKLLLLQISQSPEMWEFIEAQKLKLTENLRNAAKNGNALEAMAIERVMTFVESLPSHLKAFASK